MSRLRKEQDRLGLVDYLKSVYAYRLGIKAETKGMQVVVEVEKNSSIVRVHTNEEAWEFTFHYDMIVKIIQSNLPEQEAWQRGKEFVKTLMLMKQAPRFAATQHLPK